MERHVLYAEGRLHADVAAAFRLRFVLKEGTEFVQSHAALVAVLVQELNKMKENNQESYLHDCYCCCFVAPRT